MDAPRRDSVDSLASLAVLFPQDNYELAITGDAFEWMIDFASDETFAKMLVKCQIFARMSPDQKVSS